MRQRFEGIPGFGTAFGVPQDTQGYHQIHDLPDGPVKDSVLAAFAQSFGVSVILSEGHSANLTGH